MLGEVGGVWIEYNKFRQPLYFLLVFCSILRANKHSQLEDKDRLRDNILLAQAKLLPDEVLRAEKLSQLHKEFGKTDGGMLALYELGLLKIGLYQAEQGPEQKKQYLTDARATLESFIKLYPASYCAGQVQKNLDGLPSN